MAVELIEVKTQKQLNKCLDIRKEVFVKEQSILEEEECDAYDQLEVNAIHILLKLDQQYIATGRAKLLDEHTAKLQRIAVKQAFRGQGMGKALIIGLEELIHRQGVVTCMLNAQCHAESFYHSLGYETVSNVPFYDAGILHVKMAKKL